MPGYVFPVTEALIDKGVLGKQAASEVEAYLAQLTPESVIRPRVMAAMTELTSTQVEYILGEYATHGLLKADEMLECEDCRTLTPVDEVVRARNDGDEHPCDGGCGGDLTLQEPTATLSFQLLDTPT